MISETALKEFQKIWQSEFGEDISNEIAMEEAVNLLTLFDAVYCPIKQEWMEEYENGSKQLQKTNL